MSQFNAVNALAVCSISTSEKQLESTRSTYCTIRAFNIRWQEVPVWRIDSYIKPKGCLTRAGMSNHGGTHGDYYEDSAFINLMHRI